MNESSENNDFSSELLWARSGSADSECYNPRMVARFRRPANFALLLFAAIMCFAACAIATLAQTSARTSAQTSAKQAATWIEQAHAQAAAGRFADAIASYRDALSISPHNLNAEIGLAQAFRGVHNQDAAKQTLEEARREHPKSAAPLVTLGDLDLELQTYDAAIAHLTAALALEPANLDARNRLAIAYKAKGGAADMAAALEQIAKILARDPKNALAHYTRAQIYADQNQRRACAAGRGKSGRAAAGKSSRPNAAGEDPGARTGGRARRQKSSSAAVARCWRWSRSKNGPNADSEMLFLLSRAYRCAGQDENAADSSSRVRKILAERSHHQRKSDCRPSTWCSRRTTWR